MDKETIIEDEAKHKMSLVERFKTVAASRTIFNPNHIYKYLWYTDDKNKFCFTFTPRAGCSVVFQQYLDILGLLEDGLIFSSFIHNYRVGVCDPNLNHVDINLLIERGYKFFKFIMNPYLRAVSIFIAQTSHNLSFREYLKQLVNNEIDYFNANDKFHYHPQYIEGEEDVITKYIKINENEKYNVTLHDGSSYTINCSNYTSVHHNKKNKNNKNFSGDVPLRTVFQNLPYSYKCFYDDEIKQMVESFYHNDIIKYGFTFEGAFPECV